MRIHVERGSGTLLSVEVSPGDPIATVNAMLDTEDRGRALTLDGRVLGETMCTFAAFNVAE